MQTFKHIWVHMKSEQKQELADDVDSSKQYLSQIAYGHRQASVGMIRKLVATDPRLHAAMFL
jgi:hypothetical protein